MKKYDILIIGAGPGGMNAALYAKRSGLKVGIVEKGAPGGKLVNISSIDNWIGEQEIQGPDLAIKMNEHILSIGVESIFGNVEKVDDELNKVILSDGEEIEYKFLVIASGTRERVPDIENIEKFNHKGVSYCAICDGTIYKGKPVAVIGGGNSAVEESLYLSSFVKEVHLFVRNKISADTSLVKELENKKNIIIHLGQQITKINGEDKVNSIETTDGNILVSAVFPYIGLIPNTSFLEETNVKLVNRLIKVNENMRTSVPNIFAVGDVIEKEIRQVVTAASDGAIAAKNILTLIKQ